MARIDAPKVARRARQHFGKVFHVELMPTDAGDTQITMRHLGTGLTDYALARLGATDEEKRELVQELADSLCARVVKAGGRLW